MSERIYLAIAAGYWGVGNSPAEARAARRRAGGTGRPEVYLAPENTVRCWVDVMGYAHAEGCASNADFVKVS